MRSAEQSQLLSTEKAVDRALVETVAEPDFGSRLDLLEAIASTYAKWSLSDYRRTFGVQSDVDWGPWPDKILSELNATGIPVPLALASLAREPLTKGDQRTAGAYYTDHRLASLLATSAIDRRPSGMWVDPACGSGILLVAAVLASSESNAERDSIVAERLCGADLSETALRGARLSVAATVSDLMSLVGFNSRLLCQDSLRSASAWNQIAPGGFGLVIGNPPWERLKTTRHEEATRGGELRHYGQSFGDASIDSSAVSHRRAEILAYLSDVTAGSQHQGRGEHDLYKLFLELGLGLAGDGGILAMLVPAGLIRSQGTEQLRRALVTQANELDLAVIENRQRYFAIDTRFKFLALTATLGGPDSLRDLTLRVADREGRLPEEPVRVSRAALERQRSDLSIPEVRTSDEWRLWERLAESGKRVGDPGGLWSPRYLREVDMTNDARHFQRAQSEGLLPVVEGRHVHQFRYRSKAYVSGEGRAARWDTLSLKSKDLVPQWSISRDALKPAARQAAARARVGFCDITGQTNERTLLAAQVPAGVVCGNKVPTLSFPDGGVEREHLFLALVNSFVVDWVLRRQITTTLNFFLFDGLCLPVVLPTDKRAKELARLSKSASAMEGSSAANVWTMAASRARMDAMVANLWGLGRDELELVLADFPLLDRGQPPLQGEALSTVTKDLVLAAFDEVVGDAPGESARRVREARTLGAVGYVPAGATVDVGE